MQSDTTLDSGAAMHQNYLVEGMPCRSNLGTVSVEPWRHADRIHSVDVGRICGRPIRATWPGSRFLALFGACTLRRNDPPAVSAALVDTARILDDPFRACASDGCIRSTRVYRPISADRREEMQRLVRLHRDVKGVGPDGVRYSALSPEPWNWNSDQYLLHAPRRFPRDHAANGSAPPNQAIWDRFRALCDRPADARSSTTTPGELRGAVRVLRPDGRRETDAHRELSTSSWTPRCGRDGPICPGCHGAAVEAVGTAADTCGGAWVSASCTPGCGHWCPMTLDAPP